MEGGLNSPSVSTSSVVVRRLSFGSIVLLVIVPTVDTVDMEAVVAVDLVLSLSAGVHLATSRAESTPMTAVVRLPPFKVPLLVVLLLLALFVVVVVVVVVIFKS